MTDDKHQKSAELSPGPNPPKGANGRLAFRLLVTISVCVTLLGFLSRLTGAPLFLAVALVCLLALALAAAVLLAVRSALGANRDTIEVVHLLGGTDAQIARVFQRATGIDAAGGGLLGMLLALVVVLFLARQFGSLGAGLVDQGALGWSDWATLGGVPVVAVVLAMVTARFTVMHTLRKML